MFRGNNPATVDDKGRLKIPTAFRTELDEQYGQDFVTSLDGKSVWIYPLPAWVKIEEKLATLPSMNKAKKHFLDRTNYWGQMARADSHGRVLIPPRCCGNRPACKVRWRCSDTSPTWKYGTWSAIARTWSVNRSPVKTKRH